MTDDDSTDCARCGETTRNPAWWEPGHDRKEYLEVVRDLGWFPHMPEAPLCLECEAEVRQLSNQLSTDIAVGTADPDPERNELTEFLDEIDIDAFRDAGPTGMP